MSAFKHNVADLIWNGPGGSNCAVLDFSLRDYVSEPFRMKVTLNTQELLDPHSLVNQETALTLKAGPKLTGSRMFSGLITEAAQLRTGHGNLANASPKSYLYEVKVRPPIFLLTHARRSRVYQNKTVQQIVGEVLGEAGVAHQWKAGGLGSREYTLQYQESNLDFVQRLCEAEGVYYFYDHEARQTVFADNAGAHSPCTPTSKALYHEGGQFKEKDHEVITHAEYKVRVGAGSFVCGDYNYTTSQTQLQSGSGAGSSSAMGGLEVYDHTTGHGDGGRGGAMAAIRGEAAAAGMSELCGGGNCRSFATGFTFALEGHFLSNLNQNWLLLGIDITASQGRFWCGFRAGSAAIPFRPTRSTPWPRVYGLQTAEVVGPGGSEVYLDEMGRCKLQFHWDREGPKNDRSSMWVRVSNNYAGKDYGVQFIPRVGHEVLVEFVEGNPDHPVVVGRVYNDNMTPPLGPPKKFQNGIKTIRDHHIFFDDTVGSEMFDVRSQKDMKTLVVNDQSNNIGNNQSTSVGVNQSNTIGSNQSTAVGNNQSNAIGVDMSSQVGNDQTLQVGHDQGTLVGNDRQLTIGSNQSHTVGVNDVLLVGATRTETIGINRATLVGVSMQTAIGVNETRAVGVNRTTTIGTTDTENVGTAKTVNVGKALSVKVGKMKSETVGMASVENVGGAKTLTVGGAYAQTVTGMMNTAVGLVHTEQAGMMRNIRAGKKVSIKVGASEVTMNAKGDITIKGTNIKLDAAKKVSIIGSEGVEIKGKVIDLN